MEVCDRVRVRSDCMSARVPFSIPTDCRDSGGSGCRSCDRRVALGNLRIVAVLSQPESRIRNLALLKTAVALMPLSERPITRADSRDGLDSP
jgi:hypothetical protein